MKSLLSARCLGPRFSLFTRALANEAKEFEAAKTRLESAAVEVDNENKLKLYGLYKQATTGVCSTPKPGLTDFVGRAKWTAWSALGQLSQAEAQKQYVQTVEQLIKTSTPTPTTTTTSESKVLEGHFD